MPRDYTLWATPGCLRAGPLLRLRINYSWTHVSRSLQTYNRGASSNNHVGEKYINVRAGKSLTPPKLERNVVLSLQSLSRFWLIPRCEARELTLYTKLPRRPCFDHQPQDFAFQQKPWSLHLSVPHRQFMPCDWCPSIYNLWARTSQRRALSKRINSPPPNRCIFNRNQSTQNKIQCQTHNPFTSPFWVWTKPEALSSHIHPSPSTSGRPPTISILLGVQPNQDRQ